MTKVTQAHELWREWQDRGLQGRAKALLAMANTLQTEDADRLRWRVRISAPLLTSAILPGPTGEKNELFLEGRGAVLCLTEDEAFDGQHLDQLACALLAGNVVLLKNRDRVDAFGKAGCPAIAVLSPERDLAITEKGLAGLTIAAGEAFRDDVLQIAVQRRGALLAPIICTDPHRVLMPSDVLSYVTEITHTINTAAVGGNADLLGLGAA